MKSPRLIRALALTTDVLALGAGLAGCTSNSRGSDQVQGATINVVYAGDPPNKDLLAQFTKETGVTVKWTNIDWDSLQTKISAAATANTYFADVTNVDWSRVGQFGKLGWFLPLQKYLDTNAMEPDMPQLKAFKSGSDVVGLPVDASFTVTTVNAEMFKKAGITQMPTTLTEYTADLQKVKDSGVSANPLNIPFAAAEGLSTYWYQTTAAFGGTVLDANGEPQFAAKDSGGYQAAEWMVSALKNGLVPAGSINTTDTQGRQTLMASGQAASTFSDYAGTLNQIYNVPASSKVVNQIDYIPVPGVSGTVPSLSNPDGMGIPKQAKYPAAAAKFLEWYTGKEMQLNFSGVNGADAAQGSGGLPCRLSVMEEMSAKGGLAQGDTLLKIFQNNVQPVFPEGAPTWYPAFSQAVNTNLHAAAIGQMSVDQAIQAIVAQTKKLGAR